MIRAKALAVTTLIIAVIAVIVLPAMMTNVYAAPYTSRIQNNCANFQDLTVCQANQELPTVVQGVTISHQPQPGALATPGQNVLAIATTEAAAGPTTGIVAAGADEVSVATAALFGAHAQEHQSISAEAAAFQNQFAQSLQQAANQFAANEAANSAPIGAQHHGFP